MNRVGCYESTLNEKTRVAFEREVEGWIEEGILLSWEGDEKSRKLPLMAVVQPTKSKVRLMLDFRVLNGYVACHIGGEMNEKDFHD